MINNLEDFMKELEPKLNERDKKIKEHKELIKDVNDFCELFLALNQVIEELEKKAIENQEDKKVKEELDSYLKERELYWKTIQEFRMRAQKIENELKKDLDFEGIENHMIYNLYERRNIISKLREIEKRVDQNGFPTNATLKNEKDELVRIANVDEELYKKNLIDLENLDQIIEKDYTAILENEEIDLEEKEEYELNLNTPKNLSQFTKEELGIKKEQIIKELHDIEKEKGKKCYYKYTFDGVTKSVTIPKRLRGKYGMLLTKLHQIENQMENYIPPVKFEKDLYDKMTPEQQRAYLANIMLQIEARSELSFNKYYINDKYIPYEYKDMYLEVLNMLKKHNEKKINYYSEAIDWKKVEKMSVKERLSYFEELCQQYLKTALVNPIDPVEITYKEKKFTVNRNDEVAFRKCYEEQEKIKEELNQTHPQKSKRTPSNRHKVSQKRKPSKIEKIKKLLKKKTVQIAIAVGALVAVAASGLHFMKKLPKYEKVEMPNGIESTLEAKIEPIAIASEKNTIDPTDTVDWQNVTNFDLTPQEGEDYVNIYGEDLQKPLKPTYPNDSYRVVTKNYKMPNGEIIKVSLEDEMANEKMVELESLGGVLQTVDAVAKTGEEDYAKNKIPTGQFIIDDNLTPNSVELDEEILNYLNEGQGRGR